MTEQHTPTPKLVKPLSAPDILKNNNKNYTEIIRKIAEVRPFIPKGDRIFKQA